MQALYEYLFEKPTIRNLKDKLHSTILFKDLTRAELDKVTRYSIVRQFKEGQHVFFEGDPGSALFIILKGNVDIYRIHKNKKDSLAQLSAGTFFGELALVFDTPRTASALSTEDSTLVCLFRHDIEKLVKHHPLIGNKLLSVMNRILAQRLSNMIEHKHK